MNKTRIKSALSTLLLLAIQPIAFAEPITAMSWNIEWFPGGHPRPSKTEAHRQLKGAKSELEKTLPDIFFGQELTEERAFKKLIEVVPNMEIHVYSKFIDSRSGNPSPQQCGIASTLEAHSAWFEPFKPTEGVPSLRRGFAFAALKHPTGGLLMCYSVHLKSNGGSDTPEGEKNVAITRTESVRQLLAHKKKMEEQFAGQKIAGWIIAGDMNTNHDGQFPLCTAIKDLEKGGLYNTWNQTPKEERLTWRNHPDDTRFQPTTFDYFMTMGLKETQAKIVPDVPVKVSDHAPVLLELSLTE